MTLKTSTGRPSQKLEWEKASQQCQLWSTVPRSTRWNLMEAVLNDIFNTSEVDLDTNHCWTQFDIFQFRPISLRLKGSSRCSKTFHCVPRLILKFFSQSLEFDITTKTQFHTHLITAGVLVDTKRGGRQNNQGYRWRWLPGGQQEIWCLCHMFGSLCHLPNCHTASCLCHKNVVIVTQLCLLFRRSTASHN